VLTAHPNATFQGVAMPPGTDESGIVAPERLVRAHERQILETDFRMTQNWTRRTVLNGSSTAHRTEETRARIDDDARTAAVVRRGLNRASEQRRNRTLVLYVDGETVFSKTVTQSVDYDRHSTSFDTGQQAVGSGRIDGYLGDGRWEPAEIRTVHGREVIVFENEPETDVGPRGVNTSGRIAVDSRGVVHGFSYRERRQEGAGYESVVLTFDLDPTVDVTVDKPGWLADAKNATTASDDSLSTETTASG
jgi:hypothetical protein